MKEFYINELRFVKNTESSWASWKSEKFLDGNKVTIEISDEHNGQFPSELITKLSKVLPVIFSKISLEIKRELGEKEYLKLYNEDWRNDRKILSLDEFIQNLKPTDITIENLDDFNIYVLYEDNDMFFGHYIDAWLNSEGKLTYSALQG